MLPALPSILRRPPVFDTQDMNIAITPSLQQRAAEAGQALGLSPWATNGASQKTDATSEKDDDDDKTEPESLQWRVDTQC